MTAYKARAMFQLLRNERKYRVIEKTMNLMERRPMLGVNTP